MLGLKKSNEKTQDSTQPLWPLVLALLLLLAPYLTACSARKTMTARADSSLLVHQLSLKSAALEWQQLEAFETLRFRADSLGWVASRHLSTKGTRAAASELEICDTTTAAAAAIVVEEENKQPLMAQSKKAGSITPPGVIEVFFVLLIVILFFRYCILK